MKPRKPIKRKKPLKRGKPPQAKGRSRFPARRNPEYQEWIRMWNCAVPGCYEAWWQVECTHVRSRGAGAFDVGETAPLCHKHHQEEHQIGIKSFEAKYGIDLHVIAERLAGMWQKLQMEYVADGDDPNTAKL